MSEKRRFIFLSNEFYAAYPSTKYPEIEQKHNRPYIQVYVVIDNIQYAIPLRSDIHHPYVLWTDKTHHCGVDFSKAVVITEERYIDIVNTPYIRPNEFEALRGRDFRIKTKMEKYITEYKKARQDMSKARNKQLVRYSTLQYFEKEMGISQ